MGGPGRNSLHRTSRPGKGGTPPGYEQRPFGPEAGGRARSTAHTASNLGNVYSHADRAIADSERQQRLANPTANIQNAPHVNPSHDVSKKTRTGRVVDLHFQIPLHCEKICSVLTT